MRVALVSRELHPLGGGGIAEYVSACATLLSEIAEVAIFTTDTHERTYRELLAASDPRLPPAEIVFVPEAREEEVGGYFSALHLYSARVLEAIRGHYRDRGPDLIEFSDYLGEGAVTLQARRAADPMLRRSAVGIRLHTTAEVCAILDGHIEDSFAARITCELERFAVREADHLLWPGGDTLAFYHRFYGQDGVAPGWRVHNPALVQPDAPENRVPEESPALRLLYLGRLERRKGIDHLVRAMRGIDSDQLELSILGGDTQTAPLGESMTAQMYLAARDDPRITFLAPVPREELPGLIAAHDAVVLPSLWEAWPYVGLEALRMNRPLVATPVGGFTEIVKPGLSGWLTETASPAALETVLERLLFARDEVSELCEGERPREAYAALTDAQEIRTAYTALLERGGRWTTSGAGTRTPSSALGRDGDHSNSENGRWQASPLVSIIIPYYHLAAHLEEAVISALAQTHPLIEVIVVNDGSALEADWVLAEIASRHPITVLTQVNRGLGAARNFGISQCRGSFVVPLDADDILEPTFVERALEALRLDPSAAYVTSWSRYIDEDGSPLAAPHVGYQPLGNAAAEVLRNNVAGSAVALMSSELFDRGLAYSEELTSYEDWQLYQRLHDIGRYGLVIPERLLRYRVRPESMSRAIGLPLVGRLAGELQARRREASIRWTSRRD